MREDCLAGDRALVLQHPTSRSLHRSASRVRPGRALLIIALTKVSSCASLLCTKQHTALKYERTYTRWKTYAIYLNVLAPTPACLSMNYIISLLTRFLCTNLVTSVQPEPSKLGMTYCLLILACWLALLRSL